MSIWVFWTQIHCLVGVEYYIEIYWFVMYFIILSILCIVMLDGVEKDMMFDLKSFDIWTLHFCWHPHFIFPNCQLNCNTGIIKNYHFTHSLIQIKLITSNHKNLKCGSILKKVKITFILKITYLKDIWFD